jgi:hypothetical protein
MFTFIGGNPRRNFLKIILSSEKIFEDGQDVQNLQNLCQTARLPSSSCNEVNKRLP